MPGLPHISQFEMWRRLGEEVSKGETGLSLASFQHTIARAAEQCLRCSAINLISNPLSNYLSLSVGKHPSFGQHQWNFGLPPSGDCDRGDVADRKYMFRFRLERRAIHRNPTCFVR